PFLIEPHSPISNHPPFRVSPDVVRYTLLDTCHIVFGECLVIKAKELGPVVDRLHPIGVHAQRIRNMVCRCLLIARQHGKIKGLRTDPSLLCSRSTMSRWPVYSPSSEMSLRSFL